MLEFGKAESMARLSTDFNTISIKTFSALQHIHLHVNTPVQQHVMRRGRDLFKADYFRSLVSIWEKDWFALSRGFVRGCYIYLNTLHLRKL